MNGIRIRAVHARGDASPGLATRRDYELEDLLTLIGPPVRGLYWLLEDVVVAHVASDGSTFDAYQDHYDELVLWEAGSLRFAAKDFVPTFAKYLPGDWDRFIGVREPIAAPVDAMTAAALAGCEPVVVLQCVDALWWEVYADDETLLAILTSRCAQWERVGVELAPLPARPN